MLIYKNFILKKTTIIFELILLMISVTISLFISYRSSLYINYDNNYKETYIEIYSNKNIYDNLKKYENTNKIILIENNEYQYGYKIYLKHYYNYYDGLRDFISILRKDSNINYKIYPKGDEYQDIGDSIKSTNTILILLLIVSSIIFLIVIYNVLSDEKRNNKLLKFIGYSEIKIKFINLNKIIIILIIPILFFFLTNYIFIELLT